MGAFVTVTVGSTPVTLDTADASRQPLVFAKPEGTNVSVSLNQIQDFLHNSFGITIPSDTFFTPILKSGVVEIDDFLLATTGDMRVKVSVANGDDQNSWNIIPNFDKLSIKEFGVRASNTADPAILSVTPANVAPGGSFTIGGTGLTGAQSVSAGTDPDPKKATQLTIAANNKDNFFLPVTVPVSTAVSDTPQYVFVTTASGKSLQLSTAQLVIKAKS